MWEIAGEFADEIERRSRWQLAMRPQANIVCFRPSQPAGIQSEQMTHIRSAYLAKGSGYIVATALDGQPWFRCTFMNPLTQSSDFKLMLDQLEEIIASGVA
jgi:L-2,4-diaminobutyrate decarboxylase